MVGIGNVPISPLIVVGPVFVMPEPARTAKLSAVPSGTAIDAAWTLYVSVNSDTAAINATKAQRFPVERVSPHQVNAYRDLAWLPPPDGAVGPVRGHCGPCCGSGSAWKDLAPTRPY